MKNKDYSYLIGKKQNMLTANKIIKILGKRKPNQYSTMIECVCECGNLTQLFPYQFEKGSILSCGCLKHKTPYNATHKMSKENLYHIWETMRLRCASPKNSKYYAYGKRGIKVCDEWFNDFLSFKEWSLKNGYAPNLSIDRIDNNGNYEPTNCRWVSRKTQQRNRRNCVYITYDGKTQCLIEWCEQLNLSYKTINNRISNGWDPIKAITTPIKHKKK